MKLNPCTNTNPEEKITTHDRFRTAYLLMKWGVCTGVGRNEEGVFFVVEGHKGLEEEDLRYRTGNALADPLAMRETFRLLEEWALQAKTSSEPDDSDCETIIDIPPLEEP